MAFLKPLAACMSVVSACAALACGSTATPHADPAVRVLTGAVDGTDAQVAIVASAHRALVYFCGGSSSYPILTHWFTLDLDSSGGANAKAAGAGDWSFDGQLGTGDAAGGAFTIADGTKLTFHATRVGDGTIA